MDLGLTGKVFLVTAASAGLGLATAQQLVAEGAQVMLLARHAERLTAACDGLGTSAAYLAADLAEPETPQRAVQHTVIQFGRLDGAIVSVGGPPRGGVLDNTDQQWTSAFWSVFLSAIRVARAVVEVNPSPRLAFVLSTSARAPLPEMAISNGLRPGLGMLIKQLADEIGPAGGRVVGLMPGSIATDRMTALYAHAADPQAALQEAAGRIPLRRLGEPAEFGRVAAFAVSDAASYLSGCLIPVDGGALRTI